MKAIIFDFFGVIHDDPLKLWLPGIPKDAHDHVAYTARDLDTGAINFSGFLGQLSQITGLSIASIRENFAKASLNHDTVKLIKKLRQQTKLCLLSNAHTDELLPLLDKYNLRDYFDELVISSETGLAKPDAEIFNHTMDKLALTADEVLFIDDNPHNVLAAEALGIKSIQFKNAGDLEVQLACVEL